MNLGEHWGFLRIFPLATMSPAIESLLDELPDVSLKLLAPPRGGQSLFAKNDHYAGSCALSPFGRCREIGPPRITLTPVRIPCGTDT
jgi:hypothetical protein